MEFDYAFSEQGNDQLGSGFYFTTSEPEARWYCHHRLNGLAKPGGHNDPTVHNVEITLTKPLPSSKQQLLKRSDIERIIRSSPILVDQLNDFWGDVEHDGLDRLLNDAVDAYDHKEPTILLKALNSLSTDFFPGHPKAFFETVREVLGYDGVVCKFDDHEHLVAWFPEQINITSRQNLVDELFDIPVEDDPAIEAHMPIFHGTELPYAKNIVDNGIDLTKCSKGYFGTGFYCATSHELAESNYANMADEPAIVAMRLNKDANILDLRTESGFAFYQKHQIENVLGSDNLVEIMRKLKVDGLYDRSFGGMVIYNPKALEVVGFKVPAKRQHINKL